MIAWELLPVRQGDSGWIGLCRLAEAFCSEPNWLFRGVPRASYELIPSIGRPSARKQWTGESLPFDENLENRLYTEFERRIRPDASLQTRLDRLAVGQHHGLPTRLLDWTQSLFAAVFFAVRHAGAEGEDAAIYALSGAQVIDPQQDPPNVEPRSVKVFFPRRVTERILAQRGVFTVHGSPDVPFVPGQSSGVTLRRWRLPRHELAAIKVCLDTVGVNQGSLFPDEAGLAEYLSWAYKRDRLPRNVS